MREAWHHSAEEREQWYAREYRLLPLNEKIKLVDDMLRIAKALHAMYVRCFYAGATE